MQNSRTFLWGGPLAPTPSVKWTGWAATWEKFIKVWPVISPSLSGPFISVATLVALRLCKVLLECFFFFNYFSPPLWEVGQVVSIIVLATQVRKLRPRMVECAISWRGCLPMKLCEFIAVISLPLSKRCTVDAEPWSAACLVHICSSWSVSVYSLGPVGF